MPHTSSLQHNHLETLAGYDDAANLTSSEECALRRRAHATFGDAMKRRATRNRRTVFAPRAGSSGGGTGTWSGS